MSFYDARGYRHFAPQERKPQRSQSTRSGRQPKILECADLSALWILEHDKSPLSKALTSQRTPYHPLRGFHTPTDSTAAGLDFPQGPAALVWLVSVRVRCE